MLCNIHVYWIILVRVNIVTVKVSACSSPCVAGTAYLIKIELEDVLLDALLYLNRATRIKPDVISRCLRIVSIPGVPNVLKERFRNSLNKRL